MSGSALTECRVESAALAWLQAIGWRIAHGPNIAPEMPAAERRDYGEVVLAQRLHGGAAVRIRLAGQQELTNSR